MLFQHRQLIFDGIAGALQLRPAVIVDQQISREPGQPDDQGTFARAETATTI